jgi:hypothetical protein
MLVRDNVASQFECPTHNCGSPRSNGNVHCREGVILYTCLERQLLTSAIGNRPANQATGWLVLVPPYKSA